jgi:hypothetical protein
MMAEAGSHTRSPGRAHWSILSAVDPAVPAPHLTAVFPLGASILF